MIIRYSAGTADSDKILQNIILSGNLDLVIEAMCIEAASEFQSVRDSVSDTELQIFADSCRRSLGLFSAESTMEFFQSFRISVDDFENFCLNCLTLKKKAAEISDSQIEDHFFSHRACYDQVRLYMMETETEQLAREYLIQLTEENKDFFAMCRLYSTDENTRFSCGHAGLFTRGMLPPEIASEVFSSEPGTYFGPIEQNGKWRILKITEINKAELTDSIKEIIREKLFRAQLKQFFSDLNFELEGCFDG